MTRDDVDADAGDARARIRRFVENHPDASAVAVLAKLRLDPGEWKDVVEDVVASVDDAATGEGGREDGGPRDANPGVEAGESASSPPETPENAGSAESSAPADNDGTPGSVVPPERCDPAAPGENVSDSISQNGNTGDGGDSPGEDAASRGDRFTDNLTNREEWPHAGGDSPGEDGVEGGPGAGAVGDVDLPAAPEIDAGTLPVDLADVERWLTWKPTDDGRKVPRAPYANPDWPDKFVSAQDADVWTDLATARRWADRLPGYGLAFNIPDREEFPDDPYVLIDYDDARDPETGEIHPVVRDHVERAASYADVSTSGTGVHIFARGALPEGVKAIDAPLPAAEGFADAEIEVYDSGRYSAMTGDHIAGTPRSTTDCQAFLDELADAFATVAEGTPDELTREPEKSRAELEDVETTTDLQDVFDAVQHTGPRDVRLRSSVTHERGDGSKSLDPSWANSASGTRLAQVDDGWVYRKGMHGLDALQVVALEERIVSRPDEYPTGEDFWSAVDALRERGAHIPEYQPAEGDVEQHAVLPDSPGARAATGGWDWRHAATQAARSRDDDGLSIDVARERTTDAIATAYERCDRVLVEALPTMGKSYGSVAAAAETGTPVTVLTGRGRKEQYAQFREWCDDVDLSAYTLPSFTRDCPTASGDHGGEWAERVRDWYRRGASPQAIHKYAEDVLGRPLPCQEHEGEECPYSSAWRFDPDDVDVLIGHYSHAHKRKVTQGRAVVFDEFPGGAYETSLDYELAGAVTRYLEATPTVPFDDYTDLIENRDDDQRRADALAWFADQDVERDELDVFDDRAAHALAPVAVFTILAGPGDDLGNGWERADLDDGAVGLFDRREGRVVVLDPPALDYARSVVALDGTPTKAMWELALGGRLNHRPVLDDAERREYIRDVLNLNLVRTTDAVKPYNSSDHVAVEQDAALLEAVREANGERPALITTSTAEHEYDAAGVLDDVADHEHYGNVLGSNRFAETRLGVVIGSNHFGDGFIKKWGAYAGDAVERGEGRGADLSYGEFGDQVLRHVREHETLQAAMRFGRDGRGAVVYVHTDTLPEWVPVAGEGRVVKTWSDGARQVLDAARDLGEWTTAEIAAHPDVEIGERQVRKHLHAFADRGYVDVDVAGCGFAWSDAGLHRVNDHGDVDLAPVDLDDLNDAESAELARTTTYTWEFRTPPPTGATRPSSTRPEGAATPSDGENTAGTDGPPPG